MTVTIVMTIIKTMIVSSVNYHNGDGSSDRDRDVDNNNINKSIKFKNDKKKDDHTESKNNNIPLI